MTNLPTLAGPAPIVLYQFALTPEAQAKIDNALAAAALIGKVANQAQQRNAVEAQKALKVLINDIEKVRKQLTEPALEYQRRVMAAAKSAAAELETEYVRLGDLAATYAHEERMREQEALRKIEAERIENERKAREEAAAKERAIREQAERERLAAEEEAKRKQEEFAKSPEGIQQAEEFRKKQEAERAEREAREAEQLKRARDQEEARVRAERERAALQAQAHAARQASGQVVREDWEINIIDAKALGLAYPDCVEFKPRLTEIKSKLNAGLSLPGVTARRVTKSSVRTANTFIEV
jgi:colicin import membrane protein